MKKEKIVKAAFLRSSSSESLRLKSFAGKSSNRDSEQKSSRESSVDNLKSSNRNPENRMPKLALDQAFIKPKPSVKTIRSQSNEKNINLSLNMNNESIQDKTIKNSLQEYALLDDIISKYTLKTIDQMKKDYNNPIQNELVFKNFLAILSQVDPVFHENMLLQFSMSRAREVFNLYVSRPGQVLQTMKTLPKLCEITRVSKTILSQCIRDMKIISKDKLKGTALEIYEALKLIIIIQNKLFKGKVFVPKEEDNGRVKTQENLLTEDPGFDVSNMDIYTLPTEGENRSCSPINTCGSEENLDYPLKPLILNEKHKSSKKKLLDQLYFKLNFDYNSDDENIATVKNPIDYQENQIIIDTQIFDTFISKPEAIKIKPSKRSNSNSNLPNYMRNLSRQPEVTLEPLKPFLKNTKSDLRRQEWDEIRKIKRDAEEQKKKELLEDIKKKQEEEESLKRFLSEKKRYENMKMMKYKEDEIKEQRRLKEIRKKEMRMEILDEVKRNIQMSEMVKNIPRMFDLIESDM
ncbi:hypothetical protein SteCoe_21487 [Stentor coeruleus]|uniref:Uncharacterized protein n=1 Tax=Stentor coeruleus TaxID=5963 RepID=A0A1R2BPK0_9CILI|nr:hypothetical protein SteCoe_21487 [Stentor coeruleus]